jgi:tryptophan-rich sensory protein
MYLLQLSFFIAQKENDRSSINILKPMYAFGNAAFPFVWLFFLLAPL